MKFKVGDKVIWVSQSSGYINEKIGVVTKIVPAGSSFGPYVVKGHLGAIFRDHESYLIQVGRSKWRYWPLVRYLKIHKDHK